MLWRLSSPLALSSRLGTPPRHVGELVRTCRLVGDAFSDAFRDRSSVGPLQDSGCKGCIPHGCELHVGNQPNPTRLASSPFLGLTTPKATDTALGKKKKTRRLGRDERSKLALVSRLFLT